MITTKRLKKYVSAMPRSILRISIWNFNVLESHVHTNGKPVFFLFLFSCKLWAFLYFSDIYIGHTSRTKKKKNKARLSICWFGHNQHGVKNRFQIQMYWAGHGQSTSLAVTWLAQLVWLWCCYVCYPTMNVLHELQPRPLINAPTLDFEEKEATRSKIISHHSVPCTASFCPEI